MWVTRTSRDARTSNSRLRTVGISSAAPGFDFTERVEQAIATSDAVLVVIGPSWLDSATADGRRRIDQPDDFVRHEVGSALASGMPVVPVLVDDASRRRRARDDPG